MKNTLLIIVLSLSFQFTCFSQENQSEFGIGISPVGTFSEYISFGNPTLGFSPAVFFNFKLNQRIRFETGLGYLSMYLKSFEISSANDHFQFIKIPFKIKINLNNEIHTPYQYALVIGYAYGRMLYHEQTIEAYNLPGLVDRVHFARIGIENKMRVSGNYFINVGPHLEITNLYDQRYGQVYNLHLVISVSKRVAKTVSAVVF